MSSVKVLALVNGQNIIGSVKYSREAGSYYIDSPALLGLNPPQRPGEQPSLGLADFLPLSDKDKKSVTIHERHVLYDFDPDVQIKTAWSSMFGKLLVPSAGLIRP